MASIEVVNAVTDALSEWSSPPIFGPNTQYETPGDGSPFIIVDYPAANSDQITIGAPGQNIWRETGVFRLVIHAQRGAGVADGLTWASQLASMFRGKDHGGGFQTFAPAPAVMNDDNENGNYFTLAVAVPYQFDIIG